MFQQMTSEDGKVFGRYNTVTCINPYNTYFVAVYPDGTIIRGKDLIETGWLDIPNGIQSLLYHLSTGKIIRIPGFKAYWPLIDVSLGMNGSRLFHSINVKCLGEKDVTIYKIWLKQDLLSNYKIGDVVVSQEPLPLDMSFGWKFSN